MRRRTLLGALAGLLCLRPKAQAALPAEPRTTTIMLGRDFMGLTDLEQRQLLRAAIKGGTVKRTQCEHGYFADDTPCAVCSPPG